MAEKIKLTLEEKAAIVHEMLATFHEAALASRRSLARNLEMYAVLGQHLPKIISHPLVPSPDLIPDEIPADTPEAKRILERREAEVKRKKCPDTSTAKEGRQTVSAKEQSEIPDGWERFDTEKFFSDNPHIHKMNRTTRSREMRAIGLETFGNPRKWYKRAGSHPDY